MLAAMRARSSSMPCVCYHTARHHLQRPIRTPALHMHVSLVQASLSSMQYRGPLVLSSTPMSHRPLVRRLFGFSKPDPVRQTIKRRIPYSCRDMFDTVCDVNAYHAFLPFCTDSKVLTQRHRSDGSIEMTAEMAIGFRIFTERYTSRVTYKPYEFIHVEALKSSIFDHLVSEWRFHRISDNECEVKFTIDFLASSPLHASAVKMFFTDVSTKQLTAFIERSKQVSEQRRVAAKVQPVPAAATVAASELPPAQPVEMPITITHVPPPTYDTIAATTPTVTGANAEPIRRAKAQPSSAAAPQPKPVAPAGRTPTTTARATMPTATVVPTASPSATLTAKPSRPPFYALPVRLTPRQLSQLKSIFHQFSAPAPVIAKTATTSETDTSSPSLTEIIEEISHELDSIAASFPHVHNGAYVNEYAASPLMMNFEQFQSACATLCSPNTGVFTKYRERASLRACAEDYDIGRIVFSGEIGQYQYNYDDSESVSMSGGSDSDATSIATLPSQPSSHSAKLPSLSFGAFVELVYQLSRASLEERLAHMLVKAALAEQGLTGSRADARQLRLPLNRLRSLTTSFFALQLGMIRQVMPAMVVRRAKDFDAAHAQQSHSAVASPSGDDSVRTADRGVYLLAMVGLMESVLNEIDAAINDAMRVHSKDVETASNVSDDRVRVSIQQWCDWWDSQAELLSVLSVPGMSSLIQWASATTETATTRSKQQSSQ